MTLETPNWLQGGTYSARLDRALIDAIWTEGLLDGFVVAQDAGGASFDVDVALGRAIIDGDDEVNQGKYLCRSTATETVAIAAAPGSGTRFDLVVLQINDPTAGGAAGDDFTVEVVTGTIDAGVPATPDSALVLAEVGPIVPATASITNSLIDNVAPSSSLRIPDGTVVTADLADDSVTQAKMADDSVTTVKIASAAVTSARLADGAESLTQGCHLIRSNRVLTAGTTELIPWSSEADDNGGFYSSGTNVVIPAGMNGIYTVTWVFVNVSGNPQAGLAAGEMALNVDGFVVNLGRGIITQSNACYVATWTGRLAAGNTINCRVTNGSASVSNTYSSELQVWRIGRY